MTAPVERPPFDPTAYPLARRLLWRYAPKTREVKVSPELAAQLEQAGMARILPPDEAT